MRGRPHLCNVPFDLFLEQFLIKTVQIVHNFGFPPLNRFLLRSFCCDIWPGKWSNQNLEIVRPTILSFFFFNRSDLDLWTLIEVLLGSFDPHIILNRRPYKTAEDMQAYLKSIYHQENSARHF